MPQHKKNNHIKTKSIILSFVFMCFVVFICLESRIILNRNSYNPEFSDTIIVLGHSVDWEKFEPSNWLLERLSTALDLYSAGYSDKIIVTGGKGYNDKIPVAEAMKIWLVKNGVNENDILVEDKARNTGENLKFAKQIAEDNNIQSVLIVTNDFHMYRSMIITKDYFSDISGCQANADINLNKILAYIKEPFSIIKYKLWSKLV